MWSLALFFSIFAFASPSADSAAWRALLHMEGAGSSIESGSGFFLSGTEDPAAEFAATRALFDRDPEGVCRYPARALYFGLKPSGKGPLCERWEKWRESVGAEGIELVFAAAFINSPSSMYGHTLLKFPRSGKGELLHYTLNYGAETGGAGGVGYVWHGLTGGFRGYYATAPFYLKVKEYNFVENRDFWIYPLKVAPAELELLVAHAWELREVGFPYFFLRKNCSYYLLEFLEVARPGEGLLDSFPLWAVPMDTIRRLESKGWLGEARLRPSRHKVLRARREALLEGEEEIVSRLAESPSIDLPSGREAALLDAAYDLWRYRNESQKIGMAAEERLLLERRTRYGAAPTPVLVEEPPHLGHRTARVGLAIGVGELGGKFGEFTYRGTLHDLLASPLGYEPSSELSMGDMRWRWQEGRVFLERLDLLRLRSLSPTDSWFPSKGWSLRVGYARVREFECGGWGCASGLLEGGMGLSWLVAGTQWYALGEAEASFGGVFARGHRLGLGPTVGTLSPLWPGARGMVEGRWRWKVLGDRRQARGVALGLNQDIGSRAELRLEGEMFRHEREARARVGYYF